MSIDPFIPILEEKIRRLLRLAPAGEWVTEEDKTEDGRLIHMKVDENKNEICYDYREAS